jgi:hypothetical protein
MAEPGRPRTYSDDEFIAALVKHRGLVYRAAADIGCCPDTIYDRAKKSDAVAKTIKHQRAGVVDLAENQLINALEAGEPWAVQLALKTIGKDRGYVERTEQEVTGKDGKPVALLVLRNVSMDDL